MIWEIWDFFASGTSYFYPADQSVDKSPSTSSKYYIAVRTVLEKPCASPPGSGKIRSLEKPTGRRREDSPLPKEGREKLVSLLADLLGFPNAERPREANGLSLYESMSPGFTSASTGTRAPSQDAGAALYENCLKCRGERCRPPPRPAPAQMKRDAGASTLKTFPTGPRLKESQEAEVAFKETNGPTAPGEGKRPLLRFPLRLTTKPLRFLRRPFEVDLLFVSVLFFLSSIKNNFKKNPFWLFLFNQLIISLSSFCRLASTAEFEDFEE